MSSAQSGLVDTLERRTDLQRAVPQVDDGPVETAQFPTPESGVEGDDVRGTRTVVDPPR
ncbi:hypothetical protein HCJ76_30450 [Streptomyces sp. MC1]|uniref:hypothetical protein n=1 Tax=Streptomyces sp. MC1 TaxID=295105 RepID=UPI0018C94006|nr:hypothetical protein [Streptomyces sp. MC1]MBG7702296.1 hypothetical protein [Streptomyces sp. MC1]